MNYSLKVLYLFILACLLKLSHVSAVKGCKRSHFPKNFMFGAATSAHQVEGAWNIDGRGESNWDYYVHKDPSLILDNSNGDVASDSYHLYKRDVQIAKELGLDHYRFSIAWTRIFSDGFPRKVNQKGVDYYNNLINELLDNNIKPMVTIFHYEIPIKLQELGGWANPYMLKWFEEYARTVFRLFGDRVKLWVTVNEPYINCAVIIHSEKIAGVYDYICGKYTVLAHARVWHVYDKEFRWKQNGLCGIVLSTEWYYPRTNCTKDLIATNEAVKFRVDNFFQPIFSKTGDFPDIMKKKVAARSFAQGYKTSRMSALTKDEINLIKGSFDFLGVNYYTSQQVYSNATGEVHYPAPSYLDDTGVGFEKIPDKPNSASPWLQDVPEGIYDLLMYIKNNFGNPLTIVTENGFSTKTGLNDDSRIRYLRGHLKAVLRAIKDGANVMGYTVWAMIDNFQWFAGYEQRFGLYEVDFNDTARSRTPRKSAMFYKRVVETHQIP